jgi:hypothetical protein
MIIKIITLPFSLVRHAIGLITIILRFCLARISGVLRFVLRRISGTIFGAFRGLIFGNRSRGVHNRKKPESV